MAEYDETTLTQRLNECGIPEYMQDGVLQYILHGRATGHFLSAVFSNDLKEACNRADEENRHLLYQYVFFLFNHVPGSAWGSVENVRKWRAMESDRRRLILGLGEAQL